MKKRFTFFASAFVLVAATLLSCNKQDAVTQATSSEEDDDDDAEMVTLTISVSNPSTKSTSEWDEDDIQSLYVYIFEADGRYSASGGDTNGATSIDIECRAGSGKSIYALANHATTYSSPSLEKITSITSTLDANSSGSFVMSGWVTEQEITSSTGSIEIPIYRAAAKVSVDDVRNMILESSPDYDAEFIVKGIYLLNAPVGNYPFCADDDSYTPTLWGNYGKKGTVNENGSINSATTYDTYLTDDLSVTLGNGVTLSEASGSDTPHTFYCYPNFTEMTDEDGEATKGMTRLVVEITLGGTTYYYPLTLDEVKRNTHYHFSDILIYLRGSTDPDEPIAKTSTSFGVTVSDWEEDQIGDVTI